jgi:hypothetical protein
MIPQAYRDNFDTLNRALGDSAACLLECREKATGKPAYVMQSTATALSTNRCRSPSGIQAVRFASRS